MLSDPLPASTRTFSRVEIWLVPAEALRMVVSALPVLRALIVSPLSVPAKK